MAYIDEMKRQGNWLFKRRGFLPLLTFLLLPLGLYNSTYLFGSPSLDRLWELACFALSLLGFAIRIFTVGYVPDGTSGRSTVKPKADTLNTNAMYSISRHPLYLGNFVIWAGIVLFPHSILLAITCLLVFFLYYERIIVIEETFLSGKFGVAFTQWAQNTPAIFPDFALWQKPALPFSWHKVIWREHTGVLSITASFAAIDIITRRSRDNSWQIDWLWSSIFFAGLLVFLSVWTLKKLKMFKYPANRLIEQPLEI
jgi:protein-S-isoprenylcysteine O-methyltransferase Ste14